MSETTTTTKRSAAMTKNNALIKTGKIASLCLVLPKNKKGHNYKYADHSTQLETLRSHLSENKLGVIQTTTVVNEVRYMETISVCLETGATYSTFTDLVSVSGGRMNEAQEHGAAVTYSRRYGLSTHFNMSSDEDVDAVTVPQKPVEKVYDGKDQIMAENIRNLARRFKRDPEEILGKSNGFTLEQVKTKLEASSAANKN